jgi:hypothetical protein
MLIETIFCYALISATRTIAKIYDRRRDVLYGRYVAFDAAYSNSSQHRWSDDCQPLTGGFRSFRATTAAGAGEASARPRAEGSRTSGYQHPRQAAARAGWGHESGAPGSI